MIHFLTWCWLIAIWYPQNKLFVSSIKILIFINANANKIWVAKWQLFCSGFYCVNVMDVILQINTFLLHCRWETSDTVKYGQVYFFLILNSSGPSQYFCYFGDDIFIWKLLFFMYVSVKFAPNDLIDIKPKFWASSSWINWGFIFLYICSSINYTKACSIHNRSVWFSIILTVT